MKRYFILLLTVITFSSCNNDEDNYHFEYVPVVTADVPEEFVYGQTYRLIIDYDMPNNCYSYYHYDYIYDDMARVIKPIAIVNDSQNCDDNSYQGSFFIFVQALQSEPYIFKFWQGVDENDEPIYLTIEVPVI